MVHPLVGIHAALGELGILAFLWAFVELLGTSETRIRRAKIASLVGVVSFVLSGITGGYYYVTVYEPLIKPMIKAGPQPWAHGIVMETKEHVFLFLPFLAVLQNVLLRQVNLKDQKLHRATLFLTGWIFLLSLSMVLMGFLIASAHLSALEITIRGAAWFLPLALVLMFMWRRLFVRGTNHRKASVEAYEMVRLSPSLVLLATVITAMATAVITIAKELSSPIKSALVTIGGHHWTGTGIVLIIIFAIIAFLPEKIIWRKPPNLARWTWAAMMVSLIGSLAIFVFYVLHYFF